MPLGPVVAQQVISGSAGHFRASTADSSFSSYALLGLLRSAGLWNPAPRPRLCEREGARGSGIPGAPSLPRPSFAGSTSSSF
eukprot:15442582-Alexandrium_andersonii.AAC.1